MKYQLVSVDLDGTALSSHCQRKISKKNVSAIREYLQAGGRIFFNTGRPFWSALKFVDQINQGQPKKKQMPFFSAFNGAYIKDFTDGECQEKIISHEMCMFLYHFVSQWLQEHQAWRKSQIWFYSKRASDKNTIESTSVFGKRIVVKLIKHSFLKKIKNFTNIQSYKVNLYCKDPKLIDELYDELLSTDRFGSQLTFIKTHAKLIEVTAIGCNKEYPIKYFANKYHILFTSTVSFGDSFNDLAGFQASQLAVAIAPAKKELSNFCHYTTSKKRNALGEFIDTYLLQQNNNQKIKGIVIDFASLKNNFLPPSLLALDRCKKHDLPVLITTSLSSQEFCQKVHFDNELKSDLISVFCKKQNIVFGLDQFDRLDPNSVDHGSLDHWMSKNNILPDELLVISNTEHELLEKNSYSFSETGSLADQKKWSNYSYAYTDDFLNIILNNYYFFSRNANE